MKAVVRGTVCGLALMVALTGCGGDGDPTVGGIGSGSGKSKASRTLTPEELRALLPTNEGVGDVFTGRDGLAIGGEPARQQCAEDSGAECPGIVAAGHKESAARDNYDNRKVEFTLFAFDSPKAASAAAKNMAAKKSKGDPTPTPTKINTGADETQAFTSGKSADVVMRVGNVVAYVDAYLDGIDDVTYVTTHQVDLLKSTA
ncbi:hypothetical protein AB0N09_04580 [Streptomyces erythrochromogenes]|uniref:DUF7373 family lipoprotein n=1 Tax=Streptomyces erythrochromogenes TaxID=285574 RepID=UPI0034257E4E